MLRKEYGGKLEGSDVLFIGVRDQLLIAQPMDEKEMVLWKCNV